MRICLPEMLFKGIYFIGQLRIFTGENLKFKKEQGTNRRIHKHRRGMLPRCQNK